jgi:hypothetical protein
LAQRVASGAAADVDLFAADHRGMPLGLSGQPPFLLPALLDQGVSPLALLQQLGLGRLGLRGRTAVQVLQLMLCLPLGACLVGVEHRGA